MHVSLGEDFFHRTMTFEFSSYFQQNASRHPYTPMHDFSPRLYHRDPPSPIDMPQGAAPHSRNEATAQFRDIPGSGPDLVVFPPNPRAQESNSYFPDHIYRNPAMGPPYSTGNPYPQATYSNNMGFSPESSQNPLTDEHPSPGSEDSSQWDDPDGAVPLSEFSPPPAHIDGLPLHEETELYLRQTLSIFPPRPVDLTALPDEPSARQPRIADMIKLAIWGSRAKKLTLRQIYDAIETRYPAWRDQKDKPWQRSIRHNLSLKAIFVQVPRPISSQGKGNYWTLDVRKGELNKRSRRRRDGTAESSKVNAFEDLDPDHHFLHGPTSNNLERSGPKNDFHSDYANPKANAYALRMSSIHRQELYSEQQPNTGWNLPSSSPSYVPMDASAMNPPRTTAYPPMAFRPNIGHHMQVQDGGPTAGYAHVFPGMTSMQGSSPTDNARPSRTRLQNPGSDLVATEEGTETILRTARRYASQ